VNRIDLQRADCGVECCARHQQPTIILRDHCKVQFAEGTAEEWPLLAERKAAIRLRT